MPESPLHLLDVQVDDVVIADKNPSRLYDVIGQKPIVERILLRQNHQDRYTIDC